MSEKKYPLGVTPKFVWDEWRKHNLKKAIQAYYEADLLPNKEWLEELEILIKQKEGKK